MQQQYGLMQGEYMGNVSSYEINKMIEDAEMMGYDMQSVYENPAILAGPFRKLFRRLGKRIAQRVRDRISRRSGDGGRGDGEGNPFTIDTPWAKASISDSGFTFTKTSDGKIVAIPKTVQKGMNAITNNPAILIGGAALLIILLKKKKK